MISEKISEEYKKQEFMKLLKDLYKGIDEYYTETLERNDELAIVRADAQLQLIKEIIEEVEEIWLKKQYVWISMGY